MKVTAAELTDKSELQLFVTLAQDGAFVLCDARGITLPGQVSVEISNTPEAQRVECTLALRDIRFLSTGVMVEQMFGPNAGSK